MSLVANSGGGGRGRPMDMKASTLDPALLRLIVDMNFSAPSTRSTRSPRSCRSSAFSRWRYLAQSSQSNRDRSELVVLRRVI
jgi:hypothetical protein